MSWIWYTGMSLSLVAIMQAVISGPFLSEEQEERIHRRLLVLGVPGIILTLIGSFLS